jgi:hypothetical protein
MKHVEEVKLRLSTGEGTWLLSTLSTEGVQTRSGRRSKGDVDASDRFGRFFRASSMIPLPSVPAHAQPTRAMQSFQPHRLCLHSLGLLGARVLRPERSPTLSMRSTRRCAHGSVQGCRDGKRVSFADFPTRCVRVSQRAYCASFCCRM